MASTGRAKNPRAVYKSVSGTLRQISKNGVYSSMKMIFSIMSGRLMISTASFSFTMAATSGRGACKNNPSESCQSIPFEGPIPVGTYYINSSDLSDPNIIGDLARNYRPDAPGDWGDFRVRIRPIGSTNTRGRNGFFLHGGRYSGSAGCIDVGGGLSGNRQTNLLKEGIKASPGNVLLEVRP